MSQALELLNTLSDEEIAQMTVQPNPEGHIIVGGDRFITIPDNLKRIAVQYDHNMETVTFDCPRYWDERDMSTMAVYINYMRSDGYTDKYPADNVRADGEVMHFDWTISRNVTQVAGVVSFLICVMKTNSDGIEERHWNSELSQEMHVSKGMDCEEHPVLRYPDEVTQLLLRMSTVEQINVQADEMAQLLADTQTAAAEAEASKNVALDVSGHIRNSYASSIENTASGEIIRVDDVSSIEHDVGVWVHSKNLFDVSKIAVQEAGNIYISAVGENYFEITTADGYTANGYRSTFTKLKELCPQMKAGRTYTLSAETDSILQMMYIQSTDTFVNFGDSVFITEEMLNSYVGFYGLDARNDEPPVGVCRISNIQLEEGSVATDYEAYVDTTTATVRRFGKNLFPVTLGTYNGVTLSKRDNYYILNGTATGSGLFITKIGYLPAGTYTVSANNPKHNNLGSIFVPIVQLYSPDTLSSIAAIDEKANSTATATIKAGANYESRIRYQEGITYTNFVIKPQIELGDAATEYEPYTENEGVNPSIDGSCTVTSVSPTMTILTDTPGVTVEAEYNCDTKSWIEDYVKSAIIGAIGAVTNG